MNKIDSIGTYVGEILESAVSLTTKGFPQWVARLKAEKKWVGDTEGMKHFKLEEPAYVDWTSFDEEIVAYMVLFNSTSEQGFTPETALLNYEQLQIATGWDGTEFETLANGSLVGKKILFRVEENTYQDKTRLQVNWIDDADAPAERQLKSLDLNDVKALGSKLIGITKKAAPAKPATAAKVPTAAPTKPGKPAAPTAPALAPTAAAPTAAPKAPPKKAKKTEAAPPPPAEEKTGLPTEATQEEAWGYVCSVKGDNEDSVVEEAWIAACGEVANGRDEDTFTKTDWAKIRDIVIRDLSLTTA